MHHYNGCGLRNVWLVNGYKTHTTPYGEGVAIEDVFGLHKAIGQDIVSHSKRLTGPQFRFLRKEQELSQKGLGELLGVEAQAIARWETGKTRVPVWADHFARVLYNEYVSGNGTIREVILHLNLREAQERSVPLRFERKDAWLAAA